MQYRRFRKRPVEIEAFRWDEDLGAIGPVEQRCSDGLFGISTLEGFMLVREGDWVIKGVKGEFYPCKPDIFELTYEAVDR